MYGNHPLASLYTLPLLVWYALQVVIGAALIPQLAAFADDEEKKVQVVQPATAILMTG